VPLLRLVLILIFHDPPLFLLSAKARIRRRNHFGAKKTPEPSLQALGISADNGQNHIKNYGTIVRFQTIMSRKNSGTLESEAQPWIRVEGIPEKQKTVTKRIMSLKPNQTAMFLITKIAVFSWNRRPTDCRSQLIHRISVYYCRS
jgi:hypothetical protein